MPHRAHRAQGAPLEGGKERYICDVTGCAVKGGLCMAAHGGAEGPKQLPRCDTCKVHATVTMMPTNTLLPVDLVHPRAFVSHGGRDTCKVEDCTNVKVKGGMCVAHGAPKSFCSMEGCFKGRVRDGLCVAHGGRYHCKVEGCTKMRKKGGMCRAHGLKS